MRTLQSVRPSAAVAALYSVILCLLWCFCWCWRSPSSSLSAAAHLTCSTVVYFLRRTVLSVLHYCKRYNIGSHLVMYVPPAVGAQSRDQEDLLQLQNTEPAPFTSCTHRPVPCLQESLNPVRVGVDEPDTGVEACGAVYS